MTISQIQNSCLFVDYDLIPIDCPEYKSYYPSDNNDWGMWAKPKFSSLVNCMTMAKPQHALLAEHAVANSKIVRQQWSWAQTAEKALVAMGFLQQNQ